MRLGHGTTTLIEIPQEGKRIVVDPALPGDILKARLQERTGLGVEAITHVFLTSFRPDLRQGLALFPVQIGPAHVAGGASGRQLLGICLFSTASEGPECPSTAL